jgi:hypothetical protein
MNDIQVDISHLRKFAAMVDELAKRFTAQGATGIVPSLLHPDPAMSSPDIGQRLSTFSDAVDVYCSYDYYRGQLLGDPTQLTTPVADPSASSLAAFVSGLQHLSATATAIANNYQQKGDEDHFDATQLDALMNAAPTTTSPATGT